MTSKDKSRAKEAKDLQFPKDFLNLKCVLYTIIIAVLYWFIPRTKLAIAMVFIASFFSINWYNHIYVCQVNNIGFNLGYATILSTLIWILPKKRKTILVLALYLPYFILAWYDYFANCSFRMNPTIFPFGRFIYLPVKPDPYKRRFDELDPVVKANIANFDKYVGVSLIVGMIGYGLWKLI